MSKIEVTCPDCGYTRQTRRKNKYSSSVVPCRDCSIKRVKGQFKLLNRGLKVYGRESSG